MPPQAISEGRRLYVGNMPYTAKLEDVEAVFVAAAFPIERIDIAIDPFTGRNPSMGRWREQAKASTALAEENSPSTKRVYVGGLPRLTDPDEVQSKVRELFHAFQVENVSKIFAPHLAKRFEPGQHYYLFVDFSTEQEAYNAARQLGDQVGPWGDVLKVRPAYRSNSKA
ncbi:hypothetical protein N7468_006951 [Penicillium chermesinum]|uniref:RRM domain-containing protein n=1 Tax=Penicillium chermesinum TaxID=63820 RepID=A0A9W9TK30_9EURO|nr:uncharacterized protein N7468_006951 [Penicillium chermesinum]KAJ5225726.1 hypothetical protein N7468_006951 [Penicillium chermesinum]